MPPAILDPYILKDSYAMAVLVSGSSNALSVSEFLLLYILSIYGRFLRYLMTLATAASMSPATLHRAFVQLRHTILFCAEDDSRTYHCI